MIASGSSERGLSEVITARLASSDADATHQRPLQRIAITAAAEGADQLARGQPARRAEDVLERVGGVRVVDEDAEVLAFVDRLHPPGHGVGGGKSGRRLVEVDPEREDGADRGQRVLDVEVPGKRQPHRSYRAVRAERERAAGGVEGDVARAQVGEMPGRRERRQPRAAGRLQVGGKPPTVGVVDVDDGRRRAIAGVGRHEQESLRREVVLHARVEVEVVLGEVGEGRDVEVDRGGTTELEGVRGDLHHAGPVAGVEHPPERPLQVDRLRGGPLDLLHRPADDLLDRAEQAGADAGRLEDASGPGRRWSSSRSSR